MSLFLNASKTHNIKKNSFVNTILGILFLLLFLNSNNLTAQQYQWTNVFGNTDRDRAVAIENDSNGDIYVIGHFLKTIDFDPASGIFNTAFRTAEEENNHNGFLAKYSSQGDFIWVRTFKSNSTVEANEIVIDKNDNIYVSGEFEYELQIAENKKMLPDESEAIFLAKFNQSGDVVWNTFYESDRRVSVRSLRLDNQNNIYTVGSFSGNLFLQGTGNDDDNKISKGYTDPYYAKFSPLGKFLNSYSFGSEDIDIGYDVAFNSNNELFFVATFSDTINISQQTHTQPYEPMGERDAIIKKFNNSGLLDDFFIIGEDGNEDIKKLIIDENDNIYASGYFSGTSDFNPGPNKDLKTSSGRTDAFVMKFNENEYKWSVKIGGDVGYENIYGFEIHNNSLFAVGNFKGEVDFHPGPQQENFISNNNSNDVFLFEIGLDGEYQNTFTYGGANFEQANDMTFNNSDLLVAGTFTERTDFDPGESNDYHESNGDDDIFIQKFSTVTEVKDNNESFNISLFPNPASDNLNIMSNFENDYKIEIINMLGNIVFTKSFNKKTANINLSDINNGIYFVEITNDNKKYIEKLIVQ